MNQPREGPGALSMETFLSGAYRRILWTALALSLAGIVAATLLSNWRSGLGLAAGALVACLNFVWLHHGAELVIQRMIEAQRMQEAQRTMEPVKRAPSKLRLALAFTARYAFVMVVAYVILRGYPQVRVAFIVGLACPLVAAMCEGFYEAARSHQTSNT